MGDTIRGCIKGAPGGGREIATEKELLPCQPGRAGICEATECETQSTRRRLRAASARGVRGESSEVGFSPFSPAIINVPLTLLDARCEGARFISRARSKERVRGKRGMKGCLRGEKRRKTRPPEGAVACVV